MRGATAGRETTHDHDEVEVTGVPVDPDGGRAEEDELVPAPVGRVGREGGDGGRHASEEVGAEGERFRGGSRGLVTSKRE